MMKRTALWHFALGAQTKRRPPPSLPSAAVYGQRFSRDLNDATPVSDTDLSPNEASSPFNYRPKFRPKRIVMPVDPAAPFDKVRYATSALSAAAEELRQLKSKAKHQGAIRLAEVPEERTVADAFALCLQVCKEKAFVRRGQASDRIASRPTDYNSLTPVKLTTSASDFLASGVLATSPAAAEFAQGQASDSLRRVDSNGGAIEESTRHKLWNLLSRTTLDSPVHGALAARGKCLVEDTIVRDAALQYPRLRPAHHHRLLHVCAGLLPCCRAAVTIGLVDVTNTTTDAALWRELNFLRLHARWVAEQLEEHREMAELGIAAHRLPFFEKQAMGIQRLVKRFPAKRSELQPRVEWLRSLFHAFVAFVAHVEGEEAARNLVRRLLCAELAFGRAGSATAAFREVHPLNQIAEMRAAANASTSHAAGAVMHTDVDHLRDSQRFPDVPLVVIDAVRPSHALREAQLILAYDPSIPPQWRDAPLNFEIDNTSIELQDGVDEEKTVWDGKQRRSEARVVKMRMTLGPARTVVGTGQGTTEREAMNAAALHMVQNYYFRRFDVGDAHKASAASDQPRSDEAGGLDDLTEQTH